jgi:pyruvate formate lyase activating enzyme
LPYTDLLLYDIKFSGALEHKRYTGVDNGLILENARKLAAYGIPMIVRFVVLPGINDHSEEFQARIDFVKSLDAVEQIDLLPYHKLGTAKYSRLGRHYLHDAIEPPHDTHMESLRRRVQDQGFKVTVGG